MAIDMIEDNELGALAKSRIGSKSFVNDPDNEYLYASRRKSAADVAADKRAREEINLRYLIDAINPQDCKAITQKLEIVQNDLANETKKQRSSKLFNRYVTPIRDVETQLKNMLVKANCAIIEEEKIRKEEKAAIEDVLGRATVDAPMLSGSSKTTKYIIFGAGGLILVTALVILFNKKS